MNLQHLKEAEASFLQSWPGGFSHPEMQALGKKHKMDHMVSMAQEQFAKKCFSDPEAIADSMVKLVSRASMVSLFEKPKFRDAVAGMTAAQKAELAKALKALLHGKQQAGFEALVDCLTPYKLAKWSLVTILPNYYRPDDEVFVKPTTAKGVIEQFKLEGLVSKPRPTWLFYSTYRATILKMRAAVDPLVAPSNAAFCGFLMMSLRQ